MKDQTTMKLNIPRTSREQQMSKFKDRYVIATGIPVNDTATCLLMLDVYCRDLSIQLPTEFGDYDIPKYRLILEKVKNENG